MSSLAERFEEKMTYDSRQYPFDDLAMILQMLRDWAWLQRSQWLKKDQLAEIQARKLREMVSHAFQKVPFYQRLHNAAGVEPGYTTNTRSIGKLPIITRQHFADASLEERTAVDTNLSSCTPITTSSTTGTPITTLEELRELSYRAALWLRFLWAFGVRPSHKVCMSIPGPGSLFFNSKGLWGFVMKRKLRPLSLAADMNDHVKFFSKWKPDVLVAPPSYFRALITSEEEAGQSLPLKIAVTMGEMLDSSTRKLIGDTLHTEVFDAYGLNEVGGVAWECPTHSGYHIEVDSLVVEFLRDGEPVTAGQSGELCVTSLYRKATPIIRYLVGDIATPLDDDCPCGRGLPLMKNIEGRVVDFILTKDGCYISPYTVMYVLEGVPGVAQYKVIQKGDYSIELLVKTSEMKGEPVIQVLQQRCRQLFGQMPVSIKLVDDIKNPKGHKFRAVESQLTNVDV